MTTQQELELLIALQEINEHKPFQNMKPDFEKTPAPSMAQNDIYKTAKDEYPTLIQNAAYCPFCETIIVSQHRHDFNTCKCGTYSVDGGLAYLKKSAKSGEYFEKLIDLSLSTDSPKGDIVNNLVWGVRENNNVVFKRLSDLTTEHLQAILDTQTQISEYRKEAIKFILEANKLSFDSNGK